MRPHPAPMALAATLALALAGCAGSSDPAPSSSTAGATTTTTSTTSTTASSTPAPTSPAPTGSSGAGSPSAAAPGAGAVPTTGAALAEALRTAARRPYTVRTTVTGDQPMTVTGRGSLADGSVAAHLEGSSDTAQDVEVVGGKAWTSLPGFTTGRQRIAVDLADPSDQLAPTVSSLVALTDLDRVVTAVRSATSVRVEGSRVTAVVPGRGLVSLLGTDLTGAVPASGPVTLELDAQGRPTTVTCRVGTALRTSTYGGWGQAAPITPPAAKDVVENPL